MVKSSTKLSFHGNLNKTDPQKNPVLFIGQVKHLTALKYEDIKCKLEPRVSAEVSSCGVPYVFFYFPRRAILME